MLSELRGVLQTYLPGREIKPVELKQMMMALDVNRNGRIEKQEFLAAFESAKDSKEPKKGTTTVPIAQVIR